MNVVTGEDVGVRPKTWDKAEFYRLGELGFFDGQKVELIEGQLMVHSPQKPLHGVIVDLVDDVLTEAFGVGYRVCCQLPIDLGLATEPEPDVSVAVGGRRQFLSGHPGAPVLVVEVAET